MNAAPHEGVCSTYCLKDRGSTFNLNHLQSVWTRKMKLLRQNGNLIFNHDIIYNWATPSPEENPVMTFPADRFQNKYFYVF